MKYDGLREEELKNKVARDYFSKFDHTQIVGNIDFCVTLKRPFFDIEPQSLLWAEAKAGSADSTKSLAQLILTVGRARTFTQNLPPTYLGAFDAEKITFIPYHEIQEIFSITDFNWNVPPSDYKTKEFKEITSRIKAIYGQHKLNFTFGTDDADLKQFIKDNFKEGLTDTSQIQIDRNNFVSIYNRWVKEVQPSIGADWDFAKKQGIISGDFYLADLLSDSNETILEKLFVLLKTNHYELDRKIDEAGFSDPKTAQFKDRQAAHTEFWNKYKRPPREEYWNDIVERRDLLVPQDVREFKGSFYTPSIWVGLSQEYLTKALGKNWQEEYTVWDCAAGTGNLLAGLTEPRNLWASTIDQQDVDAMKQMIDDNKLNLFENQVFQFNFLNDSFDKLPENLKKILACPEKSKKLLIYINPPYAEATNATTVTGRGENRAGISTDHELDKKIKAKIGKASNEHFALFMAQVNEKMPKCKLAQFSKLKIVQGTNFRKFRNYFLAKYMGGFVAPANTFDNVTGQFPIGFTIWDLDSNDTIKQIKCDVFDRNGLALGQKRFYGNLPNSINKWLKRFDDKNSEGIGYMGNPAPDFQNNKFLNIEIPKGTRHVNYYNITGANLLAGAVYFAVRFAMPQTWLNDRDQFLRPNSKWQSDAEFQSDCLAYTLFHHQNRVRSKDGINHWIPFTENEIGIKASFASNFMTDFINGKIKSAGAGKMPGTEAVQDTPLQFSAEAKAVFDAGRELWRYYHTKWDIDTNVNASFYDIREYFQGRNAKGKMNNKSTDPEYTKLITALRTARNALAEKITPKIYEYEFLKQ